MLPDHLPGEAAGASMKLFLVGFLVERLNLHLPGEAAGASLKPADVVAVA
jgi:hypothetical protein